MADTALPEPRRRTPVIVITILAFVVSMFVGSVVVGPDAANASGCPAGQVQTYSKYTGTSCIDKASSGDKAVASVVSGCFVGLFGGSIASILGGCAAGAVGAINGSL